jgi:hypothetical protein
MYKTTHFVTYAAITHTMHNVLVLTIQLHDIVSQRSLKLLASGQYDAKCD